MSRLVLLFLIVTLATQLLNAQIVAPSNMTLQANWNPGGLPSTSGVTFNDIWGYVDPQGNEYGIIGGSESIFFVDVTTPSSPSLVASFDLGSPEIWRDFKTYKQYAYSVCDGCSEGLNIYDLTDISAGTVTRRTSAITSFFTSSHNIYIDEANDRLYAVGTAGSGAASLVILDLSVDPMNPTLIGNHSVGYIHDIFVEDNIAYASQGYPGYFIYDLTDAGNPISVGSYTGGSGYNHSSWPTDDRRFTVYAEEVPAGKPLYTLDINPTSPGYLSAPTAYQDKLLPGASGNPTAHNPFIKDDLMIISYYEDGVKVYDVRDPNNPILFAHYDTHSNSNYFGTDGCWGVYPFLPSGVILGLDISNGLFILTLDSELSCDQLVKNYSGTIPDLTDDRIANLITADANVLSNSWIELQAGNTIELQPGFEVEANADAHIKIGPCN